MKMFLFNFALISILVLSIYGHSLQLRTLSMNTANKGELFGRFQNLIDRSNEQSAISSLSDNVSDGHQDELTFISCDRIRPNIKNAYPADRTKYFVCRKDRNYDIFTCPNGGVFDDNQKACLDLCQQNNPCLNKGQCIILPDLKLECVCRRDWTGERCEIPVSSCAKNPCGIKNECHALSTVDYDQDYVCICDNHQSYGKTCQRTVPNPCLANSQQFHPFAFSRRAFINCDDDLMYFRPCNTMFYWNQEEKRCDRTLPDLLRSPFMNIQVQKKPKLSVQIMRTEFMPQLNQVKDDNRNKFAVITDPKPITIQVTQWNKPNMPINKQPSNFLNRPSTIDTQSWPTRVPEPQTSNQFLTVPTSRPNRPFMPTTTPMPMTTTMPTNVFRLQGFGNKNTGRSQMNEDFTMQSSASEMMMTTPKSMTHTLLGWKTNPQESSNQMTNQDSLDTPSSFQLRSWKQ